MAEGPLARGFYGTPFIADFLANLEVGSGKQRQVAFRFKAETTCNVAKVRVFFIFNPPPGPGGYFNGNGGIVKCELCTDGGGVPGTVITSGVISDPAGVPQPSPQSYPDPDVQHAALAQIP